jgi:hypothetical protein
VLLKSLKCSNLITLKISYGLTYTPYIDMAKSFIDRFQAASARELSRQSRQRRNGGGNGGGSGGCLLFFLGLPAAAWWLF